MRLRFAVLTLLFPVAALADPPTWETRLLEAEKRFDVLCTTLGSSKPFDASFAALIETVRALPPGDARGPEALCRALYLSERSGHPEVLEPDLRKLIAALENGAASYASLGAWAVTLDPVRSLDEKGRWHTEWSVMTPSTVCTGWDAAAARVALASNLQSRALIPENKAHAAELDREALGELALLHRRATAGSDVPAPTRAGLLDLSLALCAQPHQPLTACPGTEEALRGAMRLRTAAWGERAPLSQRSLLNLAAYLESRGKSVEAEGLYRTLLPTLPKTSTAEQREAGMGLFVLGSSRKSDDAWAIGAWEAAELARNPQGAGAPTLHFLRDAASVASRAKRPLDAATWLRAAVEIGESIGGAFASSAANDRLRLAEAFVAVGKDDDADTQYARAISALSAQAPGYVAQQQAERWREVATAERARAAVLDRLGRGEEARRVRASADQHDKTP